MRNLAETWLEFPKIVSENPMIFILLYYILYYIMLSFTDCIWEFQNNALWDTQYMYYLYSLIYWSNSRETDRAWWNQNHYYLRSSCQVIPIKFLAHIIVWHLGVIIAMIYAPAGFVIYGAPVDQDSFQDMKTGIPWGGSQEIHKYIQGRQFV